MKIKVMYILLIISYMPTHAFNLDPDQQALQEIRAIKNDYKAYRQRFFILKETAQRKRQYKNSLDRLLKTQLNLFAEINVEIYSAREELNLVNNQIEENKSVIRDYENEKAELEKPRLPQQPVQKSLASRAWDWVAAPKQGVPNQNLPEASELPQDKLNRIRKELRSYRNEIPALEQDIQQLDRSIPVAEQELKARSRDKQTTQALNRLGQIYKQLLSADQDLRAIQNKKYALIREIEGIEPSSY